MDRLAQNPVIREFCGRLGSPVYLLGQRWHGGRLYVVEWNSRGLAVSEFPDEGQRASMVRFWARQGPWFQPHARVMSVVNKYIAALRAGKAKKVMAGGVVDPAVGDKRPALTALMTEVDDGTKVPRERSVLMVAVADDGMRVGVKDDDLGGWLWRTGKTVQEALDAIERALQDGTAVFGGSVGRRAGKGKK